MQFAYDPHLPPVLRFDSTGASDQLPELLEIARTRTLTAEEVRLLADALRHREPWLEWTGKREKKGFEVEPVALHIHCRELLADTGSIFVQISDENLHRVRMVEDFPVIPITDRWESMQIGTELFYVVQTSPQVLQRCILMTTDPGDLVLDPTWGAGLRHTWLSSGVGAGSRSTPAA